jgi:hypothetical protein
VSVYGAEQPLLMTAKIVLKEQLLSISIMHRIVRVYVVELPSWIIVMYVLEGQRVIHLIQILIVQVHVLELLKLMLVEHVQVVLPILILWLMTWDVVVLYQHQKITGPIPMLTLGAQENLGYIVQN